MESPDNSDIGKGLTSLITINRSLDCMFVPVNNSETPAEDNQFTTVSEAG
jgi:hypothetical protein